MSLNGRIALVAAFALLLTPLWLPLLPAAVLRSRRLRRLGRARGLVVLDDLQARTIAAQAEATLPVPPPDGWFAVARNVDRYLARVDSPRRWRTLVVLIALEFAPCLHLQRPLSRLPVTRRRAFLERHLATTKGLFAVPSLARQLVRMGYYTDPGIQSRLGFSTMRERRLAAIASVRAAAAARRAVG